MLVAILAFLIGVAILLGLLAVYGICGIVFGCFWNWLAPLVVASAPHITWLGGFALGVLAGLAQWLLAKHNGK